MTTKFDFDVAIIGGGLAGLSAAIQLSNEFKVAVFEKHGYPFHKVCGEYVSMESWNYLERLGMPLDELNLPRISRLVLSSASGKYVSTALPLGGFGISRYLLDHSLAAIARNKGVSVFENCKVHDVVNEDGFKIISSGENFRVRFCCGAFGKKSNLDVRWQRDGRHSSKKYVAVKYHLRGNWDEEAIGLHNFKGGYCGISKVEGDKYCCCYLVSTAALRDQQNNIPLLEMNVLQQNPFLKSIFQNSAVVDGFPITISQISFRRKSSFENGVMMLGDAAGMIVPLAGNGMSIALRTGKEAALFITAFLHGKVSSDQLTVKYDQFWRRQFSSRFYISRGLQHFFGETALTNLFISTFKVFPQLASPLIRLTHGQPF